MPIPNTKAIPITVTYTNLKRVRVRLTVYPRANAGW